MNVRRVKHCSFHVSPGFKVLKVLQITGNVRNFKKLMSEVSNLSDFILFSCLSAF